MNARMEQDESLFRVHNGLKAIEKHEAWTQTLPATKAELGGEDAAQPKTKTCKEPGHRWLYWTGRTIVPMTVSKATTFASASFRCCCSLR